MMKKIKERLLSPSKIAVKDIVLSERKIGLVSGVFIDNIADKENPISVPVSYIERREIVVFAPVSLTFIESVKEVDLVLLIPSQDTDCDSGKPKLAKLSATFKYFRDYEMDQFEEGTQRRFAHFEIAGGYDPQEVEQVQKTIALRLKVGSIMPGKMTFEV
ncbi:hypothetical protein [Alteromonas sp. 14N.309.X.WAT.G.H12]|uniref:hypothetical protein n=1 Tax=Alteromonas sp. 14N.309.X.WAT.G.H12 TaxID=3120824 RepID=UPI002FD44FF9